MQKQKLGMTDIEVSALALGTDLIGTRITPEQSFILFDDYAPNGGNFFDTANFYASWLHGFKGGERRPLPANGLVLAATGTSS